MPEIPVNYLAILLAGVLSQVVGFMWYSPMFFAKEWMALNGYTKKSIEKQKQERNMNVTYGVSFVGALLQAYILTHLIFMAGRFFGDPGLMRGLQTAFWVWLAFVAVTQMTAMLFGHFKPKLFLIDTGYQLAALLTMAAVISLWP